jgi:hypothetical protein
MQGPPLYSFFPFFLLFAIASLNPMSSLPDKESDAVAVGVDGTEDATEAVPNQDPVANDVSVGEEEQTAASTTQEQATESWVGLGIACTYCGTAAKTLRRCAACSCAFYCTRTCQKDDWSEHKSLCKFWSTGKNQTTNPWFSRRDLSEPSG